MCSFHIHNFLTSLISFDSQDIEQSAKKSGYFEYKNGILGSYERGNCLGEEI